MKKVLFVFGTRPEAIKMAPLVKEVQKYPERLECKVCATAQHREMLDQVLKIFEINADLDLNIMKKNQLRGYVKLDAKRFFPQPSGRVVTCFLENYFEKYLYENHKKHSSCNSFSCSKTFFSCIRSANASSSTEPALNTFLNRGGFFCIC